MSYDDHTFSFYNMEDTLIKKYIIEGGHYVKKK